MKEPTVFIIDYNDGLKAAAFLMTGMVEDFTVAVDVEGRSEPVSTLMNLQNGRPHHHFGCLVKNIEKMFETGKPPYPVERDAHDQRNPRLRAGVTRSRATRSSKHRNSRRFVTRRPTPRISAPKVGDRTESASTNATDRHFLLTRSILLRSLRAMRGRFVVAIGGVMHESNSFNPAKTVLADFDGMRGTTTLTGAALLESLRK